jgi:CheY-like chemotaxis protein
VRLPTPAPPSRPVLLLDPALDSALAPQLIVQGHRVRSAEAPALIESVRQEPPLAVVFTASDGAGWLICAALRSDPSTRDVPLLATVTEGDRRLALTLTAGGAIAKPFSPQQLLGAMASLAPAPPRRVLWIDDDPNVIESGARWGGEVMRVEVAPSAEAALAALERARVDALLVALDLAGSSAFELLARLRADVRFRDLPVMLVLGPVAAVAARLTAYLAAAPLDPTGQRGELGEVLRRLEESAR